MTFRPILWLLVAPLGFGPTHGQTTDRKAPPTRLTGSWQVAYEDLALGEVDGVATFSADGQHVQVVLRDPRDGHAATLNSASLVETGDDVTIELIGESPAAPGLLPDAMTETQGDRAVHEGAVAVMAAQLARPGATAQATAALQVLTLTPRAAPLPPPLPSRPGNGGSAAPPRPDIRVGVPSASTPISFTVADFTGAIPLPPWHPVESQQVELKLHFGQSGGAAAQSGTPADVLVGTWRYFADPVTWRDGAGKGRVGYFRRDPLNPNQITQSAAEVWTRPTPPARLQFFAVGVFNLKRISQVYLGVPTVVEAVFEDPQDLPTCAVKVQVGDRALELVAHRDPENPRRFVTDPFLPGSDVRSPPPPTAAPAAAGPDGPPGGQL